MKNTDKNQPKQGQGKIKPRVRPAKVEHSEEERKQAEEALRESEEKYRSLVERANDGITIIQDGVVRFTNTSLVEMWGGTVEEVLETPFANYIHPDELPAMLKRYQQRMAGEDIPSLYETVLRRSDGSKVYVEINAGVIAYHGKPADLVTVRDITERKRAEDAVLQRAEELAALQATVLEIASPHDLPSLLHTIVERAARLLNANSGGMYLCDPARDEVRCVVSYNTPRDYTGTVLKYGQGAAGMVAQTRKPLIVDDYRTWSKRADAFEKEQPFSAVLSVPMLWHGRVTGVIHVLHNVETRHFTEADLDLLTRFANHAAVAVENARLYDEAQKEIAERKQAEDALRESEQRYRQLTEQAADGICLLDPGGNFILVNSRMCEMLGYTESELYQLNIVDSYPPELRGEARNRLALIQGGQRLRFERSMLRKDGKVFLVEGSAVRLADGRMQGILHDITERKQAEEALRAAEEKYRAIFENSIEGIFQSTLEGRFLTVNPAFARMLGYASPQEMIATVTDIARQVYVEASRRDEFVRSMAEQGSVSGFEFQMHRKDGGSLWVSENVRTVRDAEGRILYYEGTVEDITERKQMADELRQRYTELALLYEADLTINRELNPRLQLETLFKTAMQALQADHAEFSRYDAARGIVQFELGIGYSPDVLEKLRALVAHDGEAQGLIGMVAQDRQPLNLPDVHADPHYIEIDPEIRSALWVPVAREKELLGVLGVLSTRPNAFSDQHERLLSLFANQAAVALENARLFAETGRRLKRVQALRTIDMAISSSLDLQVTFDIFLEQVTQQLGVHAVDILKFDPHMQTLEFAAGRGFRTTAIQKSYFRLGEGLAGRAALERRLLHIPDLAAEQDGVVRTLQFENEGFTAYFGVPLITKGQVKGVLEIFHREPFTTGQDWIDFLEILAGQAAIAIDNVTLFNDLQRSNVELTLAYDATIEGWSHALDLRDKETEGHTQRVADLTLRLAQAMGVSDHELIHIRRGTLLHDIGKMGIPDEILRKPASLDEQEWVVMRQHPLYAYDMLSPISYLRPALDIPYCHHEKWDGSGYPRGLAGEQIPLAARLFAVVDVYDALTSDRPYREAWSRKKALEYIQQQAGQHFDPEIVSTFLGMPALHELWSGDKISQT
jgi:PAS domain S-box-containing protein